MVSPKKKSITLNLKSVKFTCFDNKKSIFGDCSKAVFPIFPFATFDYAAAKKYPLSRKVWYAVGKRFGRFMVAEYAKMYKAKSNRVLTDCFRECALMGWGESEILMKSADKKAVYLANKNSPIAEYYKAALGASTVSVDNFLAGIYAGIFSGYRGENIDFIEEKCVAGGKGICCFEGIAGHSKKEKIEKDVEKVMNSNAIYFSQKDKTERDNFMADRMSTSGVMTLHEGRLSLFKVSTAYMPMAVFLILLNTMQKNKIPVHTLLFHVGITQSIRACEYQSNRFGIKDQKEIFARVLQQWEIIGVGRLSVEHFDIHGKRFSVKIHNNVWERMYAHIFGKTDTAAQSYRIGAVFGIVHYILDKHTIDIRQEKDTIVIGKLKRNINKDYRVDEKLLKIMLDFTQPKYFN